ncbi:hypothetical protein ACLI1A_11610 [Flavobacterium sp. RHBU_3]|uniref:hypothetical protein n=1 Tax=Flavobacterium sp. RHBU_3 TaxID=3391184 RepID=UPI003984A214
MANQAIPVSVKEGNTQQILHRKKQKSDTLKRINHNQNKDFGADTISTMQKPLYDARTELMRAQFIDSLQNTGDINHPDTQQKEMDYKKSLNINDLRAYNDKNLAVQDSGAATEQLHTAVTVNDGNILLNKSLQPDGEGQKTKEALNTEVSAQTDKTAAKEVAKPVSDEKENQQITKAKETETLQEPVAQDEKKTSDKQVVESNKKSDVNIVDGKNANTETKQQDTKNAAPQEELKGEKKNINEGDEKEVKIVVPEKINPVVTPRLDKAFDSEQREIEPDEIAMTNIVGLVTVAQEFRDQGVAAKEQAETHKAVASTIKGKIKEVEKKIHTSDADLQKSDKDIFLKESYINYLDTGLLTSIKRQQTVEQKVGFYQQEYNKNKAKANDLNTEASKLLGGSQKYQDPREKDTGVLANKLGQLKSNAATIGEAVSFAGKTTLKLTEEAKQAKAKNEKIKEDSIESKNMLQKSKTKLSADKQKNIKAKAELATLNPKLKQAETDGKRLTAEANALLLDSYIIESDVTKAQNAYYADMAKVEGVNSLKKKEVEKTKQEPVELTEEENLLVAFVQLKTEEEQTAYLRTIDEGKLERMKARYDEIVNGQDAAEADTEALIEQNAEAKRNIQIIGFNEKRQFSLQKPLNLATKNLGRITGIKRIWMAVSMAFSGIWDSVTSISWADVGKLLVDMVNPAAWYKNIKESIIGIYAENYKDWDTFMGNPIGNAAGIANKLLTIAGVITGILGLLTIATTVGAFFTGGVLATFAAWLGSATVTMGTITFWLGAVALGLNRLNAIKNIYEIHTAKTAEVLFKNSGELKGDIVNYGMAALAVIGGKASVKGGGSIKNMAKNYPKTFGKRAFVSLKNSITASIVSIPRRVASVFKKSTWVKAYQNFRNAYNNVKSWVKDRLPEKQQQPTRKPLSQHGPYEEHLRPDRMPEQSFMPENMDVDFRLEQLRDAGLKIVKSENTISFFSKSNVLVAEIEDGVLRFKYSGFGGDIVMNPERTTTVLGKFAEIEDDALSNGTRKFLGSKKPYVEGLPDGSFSRGDGVLVGKGGMSFLDIAEDEYMAIRNKHIQKYLDEGKTATEALDAGRISGNNEFWEKYNYPFLEDAFKRGDDIRLVSDPIEFRTSSYKRELEAIEGENGLAKKYGYIYNEKTKTYIKNGL